MLKGAAYILADDTNAKQLNGTQQQCQYDDGGIAGNSNAPDKFFNDNPNQLKNSSNPGYNTQQRRQPQGDCRITNDAFNGIVDQFPEVPLGGTGSTLTSGIGDELGIISYPGENALGKPMVFT